MSPSLIPQRVKSRAEHASMLGLYLLKSKNCCTTTDYFSSYIPEPGDHSHAPMSDQLKPQVLTEQFLVNMIKLLAYPILPPTLVPYNQTKIFQYNISQWNLPETILCMDNYSTTAPTTCSISVLSYRRWYCSINTKDNKNIRKQQKQQKTIASKQ